MTAIVRKTIEDDEGIPQIVLLPEGETDVKLGIPVSLNLRGLYPHMPAEFVRSLTINCHAQELIEPADFMKPGAAERFRSAMLSVIRHDFLSVQSYIKEVAL